MKIDFNKIFIIHPLLFSIFPILFLLSYNIDQITAADIPQILIAMAAMLIATVILWLLLSLILKNGGKTALLISYGLVLFFSYGHIAKLFGGIWKNLFIGSFMIGPHKVLLLAWGIIFIVGAFFIIRTHRSFVTLNKVLSVVSIALVAISLISIAVYAIPGKSVNQDYLLTDNEETTVSHAAYTDSPPDIYYIVLDSYTSPGNLQDFYSFNNHEFLDFLTEKDFFIASGSHSNYMLTNLSLASSLNLEYINYLTDLVGVDTRDLKIPNRMIMDNKVTEFLKSKGYTFVHYSSGWGPTNRNLAADMDITYGTLNEFTSVLIQTTMLGPFMNYSLLDNQRTIIDGTLTQLQGAAAIPGPKYVFAHINCPHPPYLFDSTGKPVPKADNLLDQHVWEQTELYVEQLIYLNNRIESIVGEILMNSKVPPIIILQGDHGTVSTFYSGNGTWESPTDSMFRERAGIFSAYYLPEGGENLLYEDITPVNTFRTIFNFYFGTNYKILEEQSYYSTYESPYYFINVTDIIK